MTEDEMVGWHHQFNRHEFEQALGVGDGQRRLACCSPWGSIEPRFDPWIRNIPSRRKWLPTPVFLLGKSQGQRKLESYSPWGHKESDTTE